MYEVGRDSGVMTTPVPYTRDIMGWFVVQGITVN